MMTVYQNINIPVGVVKTIGEFGHPYIVLDKVEVLDNGKVLVEIEFLESGRKDWYPLNELLLDPEAT